MGCFVIIVQISNARLLFVFLDLFAKDFELKLHEVDLLLQVYDILVRWVDVWVIAELTWSLLFFVLTTEVHHDSGLVSRAVSERAGSSEAATFLEAPLSLS